MSARRITLIIEDAEGFRSESALSTPKMEKAALALIKTFPDGRKVMTEALKPPKKSKPKKRPKTSGPKRKSESSGAEMLLRNTIDKRAKKKQKKG